MDNMVENSTLFVASLGWDKLIEVPEEFLAKNQLTKAGCSVANDDEAFKRLWKEAKEAYKKLGSSCGGSGANLMLPYAVLGHRCAILSKCGMEGEKYREKLSEHLSGLGVEAMLIPSCLPTLTVLCFLTPDRERTMVVRLGAITEFPIEEFPSEGLNKYTHWHLDGYMYRYPDVTAKCIDTALTNQATLSINLPTASITKQLKELFNANISKYHYIFGNREEILELTGKQTMEEALGSFALHQTIAVTNGAEACWVKPKGEVFGKSYPVPEIAPELILNKTGAGDIWAGVYLALSMRDFDPQTCVDQANKAAGSWIKTAPGKMSAQEKITRILRDNNLLP